MNFDVSFRLLKLNKLQAHTLEREVPRSSFKYVDSKSCYVGVIPLTEDIFDPLMIFSSANKLILQIVIFFYRYLVAKILTLLMCLPRSTRC